MLTDFVSKHEVFGKIDVAIAEQGEKLINLPGIFSKGVAGEKKAILLFASLCHSVVSVSLDRWEGEMGILLYCVVCTQR